MLVILFFATTLCTATYAQKGSAGDRGGVTYGLEWGICPQYYTIYDYSFRTDVGFSVENTAKRRAYHMNALMMASIGYDIPLHKDPEGVDRRYLNVSISAGWEGLHDDYRVFPIMLGVKGSPFVAHPQHLLFGGVGTAIQERTSRLYRKGAKAPFIANAGYGYRISIGAGMRMDIKAGLEYSWSSPAVEIDGEIVELSDDDIFRSAFNSMAVRLTIALQL